MMARRFFRVALYGVLLALSLSCAQKKYDLEQIRARAEAFDREITLSWYETDNYGRPSRLTEIYQNYSDLFTDPHLIQFVQQQIAHQAVPRECRRLEYLQRYLTNEFIDQRTKELDDAVLDIQAQEELDLEGQKVSFRDVSGELFNSSDRDWRRRLHQAQGQVILAKLNPLLMKKLEIQRETCRQFDYIDYADFQDRTHRVDFEELAGICEELLYQTELIYRLILDERAEMTLGLPVREIRIYDRPQLFRGEDFDAYFPPERMVPLVQETLGQMGIRLEQQSNIHLDVEDRPEKESRPACYMISVPSDLRVLVKPLGGPEDYESLFHEMGHAQHYAHVEVSEYEYRVLGEDGITEAYAFLFENLFMDEGFLESKLGMPAPVARSFIRHALLAELSSLRYYCALFLYERQLHAGVEEPWLIYRDLWERARLTPMSLPEAQMDYLMANEDFYSVSYLEAWLLEAQLRERLRQQYGPQWYSDPRTGQFMKNLWSLGSASNVAELSRQLGYDHLDSSALRRQVERLYSLSQDMSSSVASRALGRASG